jgi:ATP-dependent Clp protease ATP-binding subunit ClpC
MFEPVDPSEWEADDVDDFLRGFARLWFEEPVGRQSPDDVLSPGRLEQIGAIETAVLATPPRSVVVIGEEGVGKSVAIRKAARRLHVRGWRLFEATATDVLSGQRWIGELEERVQLIAAGGRVRPLAWVLPDLHDALSAGSYHGRPRGLLDLVLPFVERGEVVLLTEVHPSAWGTIVQARPRARAVLYPVRLPALAAEETLELAHSQLERLGTGMQPDALKETLALAEHYLPGLSAPGNLLRLVRASHRRLVERAEGDQPLTLRDAIETLAEATGLPLDILDQESRLDLAALRLFFEAKILGQPEAVEVLVERVAMVKAGLTDPSRPQGVFLFVGPTGTGKTELAKALAEYLFGSTTRLIRLDMSEYQTADSLERLLAGPDSPESSGLITSIRKQPFAVVLLDEFEKAHHKIWDVFLQLFDDGRLTDRAGNTADFRHCVVILTSNLGSTARKGTQVGFVPTAQGFSAAAVERAVQSTFRPEFLNRIDRVVVFRPLTREVMRLLVEKELEEATRRRGVRTRPWAIEWDETAIEFLLERGFTPDLGARPLKRAVEQHVLVPLAEAIVEHQVPQGDQFLFVRARNGSAIDVSFVDPDAPETEAVATEEREEKPRLESIAAGASGSPDEVQFLAGEFNSLAEALRSPAWADRKRGTFAKFASEDFWTRPDRFVDLGLAEYLDRIEAGFRTAESLSRRLAASRRSDDVASPRIAALLAQRLYLLRAAVASLEEGLPRDAFVQVRELGASTEDAAFARRVADMYRAWAQRRGMKLQEVDSTLAVSGFGAYAILHTEAGHHVLEIPRGTRSFARATAVVAVAPQPSEPPTEVPGGLEAQAQAALAEAPPPPTVVRRYREQPSPLVRDAVRGRRTGHVDRVLAGDFDLI